ncbi:alpha/beta hydrolase [Acinetobacter sp. MD2(2019)]|uniref:alpha/beta fold hydrolase n=1 Tax=Acinetobacter sp. MD2(2019) TaxID=2605273 RepID=UPI002D1E55BE|nr:alpha/beta hydrolase [Acinetobacter sp. MD2(2019)]MEB3753427.1 alpha/beta hydrolase [Acinetobacter sp. MD2(2019)]
MNTSLVLKPSSESSFMQETTVNLDNGLQLHVEIGGNPEHPCILLIMGLGAQMILWPDAFCKALIDQGFCLIRFDNRDVGLSSKVQSSSVSSKQLLVFMARFAVGLKNHGAPYNLEDMADDVALLIDHLQIQPCHVLGASMGGMIAQILAAKYPQKVQKLGLLFTSNNRPFLPTPGFRQLKMLLQKRPNHEDEIIQQSVKLYKLIGSPNFTQFSEVKHMAQRAYRRSYSPRGVLQQLLAILCSGSLYPWNKQIQQDTLVVHGARDGLLRPKHGQSVARAIKGAKFELIAGMGHDIPAHFIPHLSDLFSSHFKS